MKAVGDRGAAFEHTPLRSFEENNMSRLVEQHEDNYWHFMKALSEMFKMANDGYVLGVPGPEPQEFNRQFGLAVKYGKLFSENLFCLPSEDTASDL